MVRVKLVTNNPHVYDIVPETMTIRELLEKHGVNYNCATTSVNSEPTFDLDQTLADFEVGDDAVLSCLPNKDSAAQATILGSSCVVKSTLTPEQISRVKEMHPEALEMYDKNDEMVFKLDIDETSPGSISKYGACFGNAKSQDGKATITVVIDPTVEDTVGLVREKIGRALLYLKDMEEQIAETLPEMDREEEEVRSMIVQI